MADRIALSVDDKVLADRHERSDAAANRALILSTAERLFRERGVENVCMAEIAEVAGVGKGTLYRRFAHKGELCLSLMDTQLTDFQDSMLARFQSLTERGVPFLEQLAQFLESLAEFTENHSPLLHEVARQGMVQEGVQMNLPHFWQYITVRALLRSAARHGELVDDLDLDYLGEALLAPLQVDYFRFQRQVRGYSTARIGVGLRSMVNLLKREHDE